MNLENIPCGTKGVVVSLSDAMHGFSVGDMVELLHVRHYNRRPFVIIKQITPDITAKGYAFSDSICWDFSSINVHDFVELKQVR